MAKENKDLTFEKMNEVEDEKRVVNMEVFNKPKRGRPAVSNNKAKEEKIEEKNSNVIYTDEEWEIQNVLPITRYGEVNKFVTTIDLYSLGDMYANGLIYYKGSIQRGTKIVRGNEISIHRLSKIKNIIDAVLRDDWHGGSLILNADAGKNNIEYDEENNILRGSGKFFIIDGNHRLLSAKKLYELYNKGKIIQNPKDYQIVCIIDVTDDDGAAKIFSEHSLTPLKIQKSRALFLQVANLSNIVARKVMRDSELYGRVETIGNKPKGDNVITFNTLISGIEYVKPQTVEQAEALSKNLIEYVNTIVNIYPELFGSVDKETREENRRKLFAAEPMFFEAYFAAFPNLIGKDDIVERLKSLRKIIKIGNWQGEVLSRDNKLWLDNITINGKIVNKRSTKKFVIDVIKEYLNSGKLPVKYETV